MFCGSKVRTCLILLASIANCSSFPLRELLSLKTQSQIKNSEYTRSYVVHHIISLFAKNPLPSLGKELLRNVILNSIMETEDGVLQQGLAFDELLVIKSKGMLSGLLAKANDGPELPMELVSLFEGIELLVLRKYLQNSEANLKLCLTTNLELWTKLIIEEAALAWKHFRMHFEYIRCVREVFDYKSNAKITIESRMELYFEAYELVLKPIVFKFDFGSSYAGVIAVFYFFQYLNQISRIYSAELSNSMMDWLQREHEKFIDDAFEFATNITTTQRALIGTLPYTGQWIYESQLNSGTLVPSKYSLLASLSKFPFKISILKVSLYYVYFEPRERFKSLGTVRLHKVEPDRQFIELIVYSSRKRLDEAWLASFVDQLNLRWCTLEEVLKMI